MAGRSITRRRLVSFALTTLAASWPLLSGAWVELLVAQTPITGKPSDPSGGASAAEAIATITAAEITRHVAVLAADSMRDRITPSPALERAAAYVAGQFQALGLSALGRMSLQRYPIPGQFRLDSSDSWLSLRSHLTMTNGRGVLTEYNQPVCKSIVMPLTGRDLAFVHDLGTPTVVQRSRSLSDLMRTLPAVLVVGSPPLSSLGEMVRGKVVFYVPPAGMDSSAERRVLTQLSEQSTGVIVVSNLDSIRFAAAVAKDRQEPVQVVEWFMRDAVNRHRPWMVMVQAKTLQDLLPTMGIDLARLLADSTSVVRSLTGVEVVFRIGADSTSVRETAPNVIGVLEGDDPTLKNTYIVFSARLDTDDVFPGQPDSLAFGQENRASGVASLLVLAKAYSQPGARPRRSLVFLATSGGGAGRAAWGRNAYVNRNLSLLRKQAIAIDLDWLYGTAATGDSLWVDGLHDVDFAPRPDWIAAEHPELGVVVAEGGTVTNPQAEYFPFVNSGLPTLGFHTRVQTYSAKSGDNRGQAERAARFLRLVFLIGRNLADADRPPYWTPGGRERQYKEP